ncbi:hypothetical protein HK098_001135 [Nowakowskiella sp. JEL0407]|nr:hypothetical protein HK098_001135 [Nowakowskiella sp. JEL0407]
MSNDSFSFAPLSTSNKVTKQNPQEKLTFRLKPAAIDVPDSPGPFKSPTPAQRKPSNLRDQKFTNSEMPDATNSSATTTTPPPKKKSLRFIDYSQVTPDHKFFNRKPQIQKSSLANEITVVPTSSSPSEGYEYDLETPDEVPTNTTLIMKTKNLEEIMHKLGPLKQADCLRALDSVKETIKTLDAEQMVAHDEYRLFAEKNEIRRKSNNTLYDLSEILNQVQSTCSQSSSLARSLKEQNTQTEQFIAKHEKQLNEMKGEKLRMEQEIIALKEMIKSNEVQVSKLSTRKQFVYWLGAWLGALVGFLFFLPDICIFLGLMA